MEKFYQSEKWHGYFFFQVQSYKEIKQLNTKDKKVKIKTKRLRISGLYLKRLRSIEASQCKLPTENCPLLSGSMRTEAPAAEVVDLQQNCKEFRGREHEWGIQ